MDMDEASRAYILGEEPAAPDGCRAVAIREGFEDGGRVWVAHIPDGAVITPGWVVSVTGQDPGLWRVALRRDDDNDTGDAPGKWAIYRDMGKDIVIGEEPAAGYIPDLFHIGRNICCECDQPTEHTPWQTDTPAWCAGCDRKRLDRVSDNLAGIASQMSAEKAARSAASSTANT